MNSKKKKNQNRCVPSEAERKGCKIGLYRELQRKWIVST